MDFTHDIEIAHFGGEKNSGSKKYITYYGAKCYISPMPIELSMLLKTKIELAYLQEKKFKELLLENLDNERKEEYINYLSKIQVENAIEITYTFISFFKKNHLKIEREFSKNDFLKEISIKEINQLNKEIFEELESDYNIVNSLIISSFFFEEEKKNTTQKLKID